MAKFLDDAGVEHLVSKIISSMKTINGQSLWGTENLQLATSAQLTSTANALSESINELKPLVYTFSGMQAIGGSNNAIFNSATYSFKSNNITRRNFSSTIYNSIKNAVQTGRRIIIKDNNYISSGTPTDYSDCINMAISGAGDTSTFSPVDPTVYGEVIASSYADHSIDSSVTDGKEFIFLSIAIGTPVRSNVSGTSFQNTIGRLKIGTLLLFKTASGSISCIYNCPIEESNPDPFN